MSNRTLYGEGPPTAPFMGRTCVLDSNNFRVAKTPRTRRPVSPRVVLAVCEGACNPSIREIDAMVEAQARVWRIEVAAELVVRQRRELRTVRHLYVGRDRLECCKCGMSRQWGATA